MPIRPALAAVLALLCTPASAQPILRPTRRRVEVDAEIVLAVDASRSMDMEEFAVQRDGYVAALRHPDLIRAVTAGRLGRVAIAYFEWSGEAQDGTLIPWRDHRRAPRPPPRSPTRSRRCRSCAAAAPRSRARSTSPPC